MKEKKVVITGVGPVTPNGIGRRDFWENIINGEDFVETLPLTKDRGYGNIKGLEIKKLNLDDYFLREVKKRKYNRKNYAKIKSSDRFIQLGVLGTKLALEDASLKYDKENNNIGTFIGNAEEAVQSNEEVTKNIIRDVMKKTLEHFNSFKPLIKNLGRIKKEFDKYNSILGEGSIEEFVDLLHKNYGNLDKFTPPSTVDFKSYAVPAKISSFFDFHGPSLCINTACSSGLDAIGQAYFSIKSGLCNVALSGGSESPISLQSISALNNLGVISKTKPRPYCNNRDGFALSEGAGILVLEEKRHAQKRGAKIYAEIKGYNQTNDANVHMAALNPSGKYLFRTISNSLKNSKLNKSDIDYVNTHGTSTKSCDYVETLVLKQIFNGHAYDLNISSTKSMTGHSIGAVGGIESIITSLATDNDLAPPTINLNDPDPFCDLNYTPNKSIERKINNSLITSMGFGGYNAALIIGKHNEK